MAGLPECCAGPELLDITADTIKLLATVALPVECSADDTTQCMHRLFSTPVLCSCPLLQPSRCTRQFASQKLLKWQLAN